MAGWQDSADFAAGAQGRLACGRSGDFRMHAAHSPAASDTLVVIPTYNEADDVVRIVEAVLALGSRYEVLVVDDHSPDGTAGTVDALTRKHLRLHLLCRQGPRGLGLAYAAGFAWGLRRGYRFLVQMDADFSHDPKDIPRLRKAADEADLVIGSRYCGGGKTTGWPWIRRLISRSANAYAHLLLQSRVCDLTAGFKCWRRELLERIDLTRLYSEGYGFQVEMTFLAERAGVRISELPITFRERSNGCSKMSPAIARRAAWQVARLAWDQVTVGRHRGLQGFGERDSRQNVPPATRPRRVLAMCLGGIGDTVLTIAMLRQLRQRLPDAHITALTMWPQAAELLEDLGIFDRVEQHNFQNGRMLGSLRKLAELHVRRFDLSILACPANRWEFNAAAWLIHARQRIGHAYVVGRDIKLSWLLTHRVQQAIGIHTVDENLRLLPLVAPSCELATDPPDIRLGPLAPVYHVHAELLLAGIQGPYLGVHAGCATFKEMVRKRWPRERFAELCCRAHRELGLEPLLFGSGEEVELNRWIARQAGVGEVIETPSLRHTAAVMQRCTVFVSNDSALAHVASALDVPTVMIVGPTDPRMFAPYRPPGVALTAGVRCAPCYLPSRSALDCPAGQAFACLRCIEVDRVVDAVRHIVEGQKGRLAVRVVADNASQVAASPLASRQGVFRDVSDAVRRFAGECSQ